MNNYTFKKLIGSEVSIISSEGKEKRLTIADIQIPRIQRDYAQGRETKDVSKIRNAFLTALYSALVSDKEITLDFLYGDVNEIENHEEDVKKEGILTLLDGQQRMTTLFLLYWYISRKESIPTSETEFIKHFSYDTRPSARDFCEHLCNYEIDLQNLESDVLISSVITNQAWFQFTWKYDPTIQSMLVMLNAIHRVFFDYTIPLWDRIVNKINFYFLPLHKMGLSDELYIKMNSRGKPLTRFEHFKAYFEKVIESQDSTVAKEIGLDFDVKWADAFFPYRGENNIIDDEMLMFFSFISKVICYEQGIDISGCDEFEIVDKVYSKENENGKENILKLKAAFDCLSVPASISDFFNTNFTSDVYEEGKVKIFTDVNLFERCCDSQNLCTFNEFILFYSVILFWQNQDKISIDEFLFRIRIIRNLIQNSSDEMRENKMQGILSTTKEIMLEGLINDESQNFNSFQKQEERKKLNWFNDSANSEYRSLLLELESGFLLRGSISVIGLENKDNFAKFIQLSKGLEKGSVKFDSLNCALLSILDYSQGVSWRYQLGSRTHLKTWLDLFHISSSRTGFNETKTALNLLLRSLSTFSDESLGSIVKNYLESDNLTFDWRYYFIKYPWMRCGNSGMYYWRNRIEKPYEVLMMNTEKSLGGYNWEVFSNHFYRTFPEVFCLNNFAYSGDKLLIRETGYFVEFKNSFVEVLKDGKIIDSFDIPQRDGIDIQDRIPLIIEFLNKYVRLQ